MVALKDILLQVLLAGSAVVLIPLFYLGFSKQQVIRNNHIDKVNYSFTVTCVLSMLFCLLFALSEGSETFPLSLSIIPVTLAILYCTLRIGAALSLLHILFYFLVAHPYNLYEFLIHTGILLYPIVWLSAKRFKQNTSSGQMRTIIWLISAEMMVSGLLRVISASSETALSPAFLILSGLGYMTGALVAGSLSQLWLERMKHYRGMEQHLSEVHHYYITETEKLHQILNAVPLSIATVDREGRIVFVNELMKKTAKEQLPCTSAHNLIGQHASQFVEQEQAGKMEHSIHQAIAHGEANVLTVRYGSNVFLSRTVPIYAFTQDGARIVPGAMLIIQDITELEMLRSELDNVDRLSLVGQMAASITHEVRNPMAVVRGFLQLMQEKSPESLDHYYRIVLEELDRANSIINDFLSLAQNRIAEKEESQLHDIIHELSPLLWADANLRGQSIELMLAHNVPKLNLNAKEIKQVVLNLARNGMEAMNEKGVLTLETRTDGDKVELCVHDTGPGIPMVKQEKLFEPFYTTKAKGTGLGLSMCLSIVERHNGTITVESEEGRGTTFKVAFQR
ncbi:PAS domain S-box protein [Paenibacillus barcinonensis]|uniref:histidine kinase n=1 Tax=Paenibacillus barcinonensis TaxID=198119 RepID=A0A2V4V0X9_PAEBA|nr:ATP-binding protein [Paenibacillus barcinonensis]PYE42426.1 PAS domain S-box-containing protein [Paenibacillus barcinonensis]QKS58378.1 PAS domain S-box protein [Paenibacillus barcinonensis]